MRRFIGLALGLALAGAGLAKEGEVQKLDPKVAALLKKSVPALTDLAASKDVVAEVLKRNAEGMTDAAAKAFQARWVSKAPADEAACKPYLDNRGSVILKAAMVRLELNKVFSLDKRGNVASTAPKAHDFVHGDQPKFQECFKLGKAVVNKPAKDVSSGKFAVQISVPIVNDGKTVGVLVGTYHLVD